MTAMSTMTTLGRDTSAQTYLERFAPLLGDEDITEIAINGPDLVFVERRGVWEAVPCSVSEAELIHLGTAVARLCEQEWNERHPLLSASIPNSEFRGARAGASGRGVGNGMAEPEGGGGVAGVAGLSSRPLSELRLQLARPPAVPPGTVSITIRKPIQIERTLAGFGASGAFGAVRIHALESRSGDTELKDLLERGVVESFLRRAVQLRRNIVVAGATGSGKTTFMKALVCEIPRGERLITIEDVRELTLPHSNHVNLLYSKGDQSTASVTARDLLEACLRMKPCRILLAELRGAECLYYVRNAASGHPGSITSVHAGSPDLAFEHMAIMIKDSPGGAFLDFQTIQRLLHLTVDIVVQLQNQGGRRHVSEIRFEPRLPDFR
jgi:type IV secretion system protein VirB11